MRYVVLGGGIAGVCCAEEICKLCPKDGIVLVSSDNTLKVIIKFDLLPIAFHVSTARTTCMQGVGNVVKYTDNLESFESKPIWAYASLQRTDPNAYLY